MKKKKAKSTKGINTSNSKQAIEKMKYEIASELGVNLGPDSTSRANGTVGGEITKRLIKNGMNKLGSTNNKSR